MMGVGVDDAFLMVDARDEVVDEVADEAAASVEAQPTEATLDVTLEINAVDGHAKASGKRAERGDDAAVRAGGTAEVAARNVSRALSRCGASILLSSTTNAISFALGAQTDLPALRNFCIFAAVGASVTPATAVTPLTLSRSPPNAVWQAWCLTYSSSSPSSRRRSPKMSGGVSRAGARSCRAAFSHRQRQASPRTTILIVPTVRCRVRR